MRILQIVVDLKQGGLENLIANISRGLKDRGHEVHILCLSAGGQTADFLKQEEFPVHIPSVSKVRLGSLQKLRRIAQSVQPDVIHMHTLPAGTFGRLAFSGLNIRLIYHVHTTLSIAHQMGRSLIVREWALSHFPAAILSVSEAVKHDLVKRIGIRPAKITVLSGGVPDLTHPTQMEARKVLGLPLDKPILSSIASLTPVKDHSTLLKAMALLPDANLLLAGEGPLKEELAQQAQALGIARRVIFHGFTENIPQIVSASDLVVQTSYPREGLGLALIEAFRGKRPVVATSVGGMKEVVTRETGLLVPPRSPEKLARALNSLLENRKKRIEMGQAARERFLDEYELSTYCSRLETIYQSTP